MNRTEGERSRARIAKRSAHAKDVASPTCPQCGRTPMAGVDRCICGYVFPERIPIANQRRLGSELLTERFPQARALWSHTFGNRDGYPQAFTLTAYNIDGRVVILQEFAEQGNSWDVYVQASDSGRIDDTLDAVAARLAPPTQDINAGRGTYRP